MPSKIDPTVRERALRMIADHRRDYPSDTALARAVAGRLGVGRETVRRWLVQADVDAGSRPGASSDEQAEIKRFLTCAAGTDPTTIVWVATGFRPEHRAAIDWLNARTDESTRFFAVEIEVVRIGDSAPAPGFKLVAQPNDWEKQVKAEKASLRSGKAAAYGAFWTELLGRIRANHPDWTRASVGPPQSWITLPYGTSNVWYGMVFALTGPRVELYFGANDAGVNEAAYNAVLAQGCSRRRVRIETPIRPARSRARSRAGSTTTVPRAAACSTSTQMRR